MARIRTIKPEFCTSEQIVECSTNARLLFVCMWCFCDDAGRHPANAKRLKMEVFPGDAFTDAEIQAMVSELLKAGLLSEYKHDNLAFWQVTGWKKHQKIDRPSYKYPPFDNEGRPAESDECSTSIRRVLDEHSPPEGNGREWNGMEGKGVSTTPVPPVASLSVSSQSKAPKEPKPHWEMPEGVNLVHWNDWLTHRKAGRASNTPSAWARVEREAAKAGWSIPQVIQRCAEKSWIGFEAEWVAKDTAKPSDIRPKTVYPRPTKAAS